MPTCDTCGSDYPHAFTVVTADGRSHTFDSFECAIHRLAPACGACGCRVIGHGVGHDGAVYCGHGCAKQAGSSRSPR